MSKPSQRDRRAALGARVRRAALVGWAVGLWLGLADGAQTLHTMAALAGPWQDRLGTLLVAMSIAALATAMLFGVAALPIALVRRDGGRGRPGARGRTPRIAAGAALVSVLAALAIAFGGWTRPGPAAADRLNVLLISIDTLRADHLSAYGYERETSPHLAALARRGVLFETAYTNSSWTLASHVSMLTGLTPLAHGIVKEATRVPERQTLLAEVLRAAGYWTGGWVGTDEFGYVGARYDIDQGFDVYRHHPHPARFRASGSARMLDALTRRWLHPWIGSGSAQVDAAIAWLRGQRREPFFLFMHFYDVHSRYEGQPYRAPGAFHDLFCPGEVEDYSGCRGGLCASTLLAAVANQRAPAFAAEEVARQLCLYDGAIAYIDREVGRLLAALEEQGVGERTLVIVTTDHGEAFMEHESALHYTLYEEVSRIPLIIRLPGGLEGKKARGIAQLVDLVPTILEALGLASEAPVQGTSLVPVLREWSREAGHRAVGIDRHTGTTYLREGAYKLIDNEGSRTQQGRVEEELYDLSRDDRELLNLAPHQPEAAAALRGSLRALRASSTQIREALGEEMAPAPAVLTDEERLRLEALGYAEVE